MGADPRIIIEPTCGKGHFILAALQTFDNIEEIYGVEIYEPYIDTLKISILQHFLDHPGTKKIKIRLFHQNIFDFDFDPIKKSFNKREILAIGNPPWVTNSKLSTIQSNNLPKKSNIKRTKGIDDFYYYWFKSPVGQHAIASIVTGSAQPKFNKTTFKKIVVPVPPIETQRKIALCLKTIDEKIECNKSINDNLAA